MQIVQTPPSKGVQIIKDHIYRWYRSHPGDKYLDDTNPVNFLLNATLSFEQYSTPVLHFLHNTKNSPDIKANGSTPAAVFLSGTFRFSALAPNVSMEPKFGRQTGYKRFGALPWVYQSDSTFCFLLHTGSCRWRLTMWFQALKFSGVLYCSQVFVSAVVVVERELEEARGRNDIGRGLTPWKAVLDHRGSNWY